MLVVCVVCAQPRRAHKFFTAGPACRSCVETADSVYTVFEIRGVRFREELKRARATAPVEAVAGNRKAV